MLTAARPVRFCTGCSAIHKLDDICTGEICFRPLRSSRLGLISKPTEEKSSKKRAESNQPGTWQQGPLQEPFGATEEKAEARKLLQQAETEKPGAGGSCRGARSERKKRLRSGAETRSSRIRIAEGGVSQEISPFCILGTMTGVLPDCRYLDTLSAKL